MRRGPAQTAPFNAWRATVAGASASLVGIGLARFAYSPLLPAIIGHHWFSESTAAYLSAANLVGYLAGALGTRLLTRFANAANILRAMMGLVTLAFIACAFPLSVTWFFVWRFLSGLAGGVLMVLAAPTVLAHIAPARRGAVSGAIFSGIGLGVAASGTLVPLLLRQGLMQTWFGLAAVSLILTVITWQGWPPSSEPAAPAGSPSVAHHRKAHPTLTLRALYVEYALNAAGLVPHMIFLVDYVARGLGKGLDAGSHYWVLYGIGAIVGPLLVGHLADRIGFGRALRVSFVIQIVAVALPTLGLGAPGLMISSVVVGAFTPGIVPLVLGRVHELLAHHPSQQKAAWSNATTGYAALQAGGAYALSYLFTISAHNYLLLFVVGAAALSLALIIDVVTGLRESRLA